jgi:hypothetical protein
MIQDPANHINNVTLKLKRVTQEIEQSVREFANLLKKIKKNIFKMLYKETHIWSLLNRLHTEVYNRVLRKERKIRSREQIIAAA